MSLAHVYTEYRSLLSPSTRHCSLHEGSKEGQVVPRLRTKQHGRNAASSVCACGETNLKHLQAAERRHKRCTNQAEANKDAK